MYRLGNLILSIGILIFISGGLGIITNFIPKDSSTVPILAALALIFVGVGASMKKNKK